MILAWTHRFDFDVIMELLWWKDYTLGSIVAFALYFITMRVNIFCRNSKSKVPWKQILSTGPNDRKRIESYSSVKHGSDSVWQFPGWFDGDYGGDDDGADNGNDDGDDDGDDGGVGDGDDGDNKWYSQQLQIHNRWMKSSRSPFGCQTMMEMQ